ncbi:MAG: formylglycine-generating enzyme family protein [Planctomycetia bacterium]|nr:formylglycine-generating enzyme family protein [Planctomycetia bacterium]
MASDTQGDANADGERKISAVKADAVKFPSNGTVAGEEATITLHGIPYRFRWCPAGTFQMGSALTEVGRNVDEKPTEAVVPHGFWILETEVTMQMFASFVRQTEYKTDAERDGVGGYRVNLKTGHILGPDPTVNWKNIGYQQEKIFPVTNVTWYDAQKFVEWFQKEISTHEDPVDSRRQVRLPSEMQWEYACRAGRVTRYGSGDDLWELAEHANLRDIRQNQTLMGTDEWKRSPWTLPQGGPFRYTGRVGSFTPNAWGIFDMHGNVWEWCADGYADYEHAVLPGENASELEKFLGRTNPDLQNLKVMRGGGWNTAYISARCANRSSNVPSRRFVALGFRFIVLPMEPEVAKDASAEEDEDGESTTDSIFGGGNDSENDDGESIFGDDDDSDMDDESDENTDEEDSDFGDSEEDFSDEESDDADFGDDNDDSSDDSGDESEDAEESEDSGDDSFF